MTRKISAFLTTTCMLCLLGSLEPVSRTANAQFAAAPPILFGGYAFQFTGSIFLPPPFNLFNGPFYRNGRLVADGQGNFQTTVAVSNYNGTVNRETFGGTYRVNGDGTFPLSIPNLPFPAIPAGVPNLFTFD